MNRGRECTTAPQALHKRPVRPRPETLRAVREETDLGSRARAKPRLVRSSAPVSYTHLRAHETSAHL
eukprot:4357386-Alexandrium_andersonii.AAC.1